VNAARKRAARLAIYLECAGVVPIIQGSTYRKHCASLEDQYCSLDVEVRQRARVEGRDLIRKQGIETAAIRLIPVAAPVCDLSNLSSDQRRRVRAEYRRKIRRNSVSMLLCPKCRIGPGMPKRSWCSRERAEEARARQNDPRLRVYPCPAQPGFWHLGHVR
jgi:hypothetical protein